MKTAKGVADSVLAGFKPFAKEIGPRGICTDDVEHLLKIPIRRISLYDINKAHEEMEAINARIKEINHHLKNITAYALRFLDGIIAKIKADEELFGGKRRTKVGVFDKIDVKEVARKDVQLKYDSVNGYLGTSVSGGEVVAELSPFDRILVIRGNGLWSVTGIPDKDFIGQKAVYIGEANKELISPVIFTVIYTEPKTGYPCIKRFQIEGWIMNKDYALLPDGCVILHGDTRPKFTFTVKYKPKPRLKVFAETFKAQDYNVKGIKAGGVRLSNKEALAVETKQ
jgi:topoisomerase-4 subunit A